MSKSSYYIVEQVTPAPAQGGRYRLVETNCTIDGPRSRLTDFVSDDLDQLRAMLFQLADRGD